MTCTPSRTKCEWQDLRHFVAHINEQEGRNFERLRCLDQGGSAPNPEVLCRDNAADQELTIERKSTVWPIDHVQQHHNQHDVLDQIRIGTADAFTLQLSAVPNIQQFSARRAFAAELSDNVQAAAARLNEGEEASGTTPVAWRLRKENAGERDDWEPAAGLRIESPESPSSDLADPRNLPPEFIDGLQNVFAQCERKFATFMSTRRVLLIEPFPRHLFDLMTRPWWAEVLRQVPVPDAVGEIWVGCEYEAGDWLFDRVH